MKNEHLLPVNIIDLVSKFNNAKDENEKMNYQLRIEAIRDYCSETIFKHLNQKPIVKKNTRRMQ